MLKKRDSQSSATGEHHAGGTTIKLRAKWADPSLDDIAFMLRELKDKDSAQVEQQWLKEATREAFRLVCRPSELGQAEWTLFTGTTVTANQIKWRHETGDVALIHGCVLAEWAGATTVNGVTEDMVRSQAATTIFGISREAIVENSLKTQGTGTAGAGGPAASDSTLQGDLTMIQVPSLLQSVKMSQMTGRLLLEGEVIAASLYFADGELVHAEHGASTGDAAVIEVIAWQQGKFRFCAGERTVERSVKRKLDSLLMEGVAFVDQKAYVQGKGLQLSSYPIRRNPLMKDAELSSILSRGAPVDLKQQLSFYWQIDDCRTLMDILRSYPIPELEWVPILFNLLTLDLVTLSTTPAKSKVNLQVIDKEINMKTLEMAIKAPIRAETELFTYPALLYFMHQEFCRLDVGGPPFSLIVFQASWLNEANQRFNLTAAGVKEMARRIEQIKRPFEILAHYETLDFALLLPQTEVRAAALVAQRLVLALRSAPLNAGIEPKQHSGRAALHMGVAGLPSDGSSIGSLLAASLAAKNHAQETRTPVVLFNTMLV